MTQLPPIPSRRRWFQFSLRTLLIVVTLLAVPCAYVAHERQVVRERAEVFKWLMDHQFRPHCDHSKVWYVVVAEPPFSKSKPPWLRRLFDDALLIDVAYPDGASENDVDRVKAAFPEAKVNPYWWKD